MLRTVSSLAELDGDVPPPGKFLAMSVCWWSVLWPRLSECGGGPLGTLAGLWPFFFQRGIPLLEGRRRSLIRSGHTDLMEQRRTYMRTARECVHVAGDSRSRLGCRTWEYNDNPSVPKHDETHWRTNPKSEGWPRKRKCTFQNKVLVPTSRSLWDCIDVSAKEAQTKQESRKWETKNNTKWLNKWWRRPQ